MSTRCTWYTLTAHNQPAERRWDLKKQLLHPYSVASLFLSHQISSFSSLSGFLCCLMSVDKSVAEFLSPLVKNSLIVSFLLSGPFLVYHLLSLRKACQERVQYRFLLSNTAISPTLLSVQATTSFQEYLLWVENWLSQRHDALSWMIAAALILWTSPKR